MGDCEREMKFLPTVVQELGGNLLFPIPSRRRDTIKSIVQNPKTDAKYHSRKN
jgi:hypothetical protein